MNFKKDALLKNYSTFKIGGPAKFFCVAKNFKELKEAVEWAVKNNEKIFVLGGGSNILFSDEGFNGLVIKIENSNLNLEENEKVICGAGLKLNELVLFSIDNNLTGLEWAIGIPGTVGGAIRGNAGAFGSDMADSVEEVKALKIAGNKIEEINLNKENCQFGYRNSLFKEDKKLVIWEVKLALKKGARAAGKKMAGGYLNRRKEKQPADPSVGSIFQNPEVAPEIVKNFEEEQQMQCRNNKVPAGWLVDQCGLRGKIIGGAQVSEKHANFIINTGNATAEDVIMLISIIKQKVRNNFKIQLREEIEIAI